MTRWSVSVQPSLSHHLTGRYYQQEVILRDGAELLGRRRRGAEIFILAFQTGEDVGLVREPGVG